MNGVLYLVGVPIGHKDDITLRAVKTLEKVNVIAAEDTRKAKRLFSELGISGKKFLSHGAHNEHESVHGIVKILQQGEDVAYVSDAGMPCISDPGYLLVSAVSMAGLKHVVVPGVTAVTTAIAGSGLPSDKFYFHGFLPRKTGERKSALESLNHLQATLVFYEAPHRLLDMLASVSEVWPKREIVVSRELTKVYEEYQKGTATEMLEHFRNREEILGEFCILVEGANQEEHLAQGNIEQLILQKLNAGDSAKDIRDELIDVFSGSKKELYKQILALKSSS